MDGLQNNYQVTPAQQVECTGRNRGVENPIQQAYTPVEDGDKKLRNALIGLGVAAVAGVALYKTGAIGKVRNLITKKSNKVSDVAQDAAKATKNGGIQEVIGRAKAQGLETVTLDNGKVIKVSSMETSLKEVSKAQQDLTEAIKKRDKIQQAIQNAKNGKVNIDGKTIGIKRAEGNLGNIKGEINKLQAVVDKHSKNITDVQVPSSLIDSGKGLSQRADSAVKRANERALKQNKQALSKEAQKKIYNDFIGQKLSEKNKQLVADGYRTLSLAEFLRINHIK